MNRPKRGFWACVIGAGLLFALVASAAEKTSRLNRFECLRAMMAISDRGVFQLHRKGVEGPFAIESDKYIVFPEVKGPQVTGFYIYDERQAWYYDGIERGGTTQAIADLRPRTSEGILDLTAQPNGLETITVPLLPGFVPKGTGKNGPVMLGSSVLPVVGALVSRPQRLVGVYYDPSASTSAEVKAWMVAHTEGSRAPARVSRESEIPHTILHLVTIHGKDDRLWEPLAAELKIRQQWMQTHNLDEQTFKQVSRAIEGRCRQEM